MELNSIKFCEHRNLIDLNKVVTTTDTVWVVEEFVRWSLARALQQRNSPMPELQIAYVAREVSLLNTEADTQLDPSRVTIPSREILT